VAFTFVITAAPAFHGSRGAVGNAASVLRSSRMPRDARIAGYPFLVMGTIMPPQAVAPGARAAGLPSIATRDAGHRLFPFFLRFSHVWQGRKKDPSIKEISQDPGAADRAPSVLGDALKSRNPETRKHAVRALRLVDGQNLFTARLEAMLHDSDVPVRVAAVEALGERKNGGGIAPLKTALNGKGPEVRFAAAKALFRLHDPAGRDFLIRVLNGQAKTASGMVGSHIRAAKRTLEIPNELFIMAVNQGMVPVPHAEEIRVPRSERTPVVRERLFIDSHHE